MQTTTSDPDGAADDPDLAEASGDAGDPPPGAQSPDAPRPTAWSRSPLRWLCHPGGLAVTVWALATPFAFQVPGLADKDPFTVAGATLPLASGLLLIGVVLLAASRWRGDALAGVAAGLAAAWMVLMLRGALHGTPFGFGGLFGDMLRMSAAATRYTVTASSSDTIIEGLASEYPPFYPWLIGRASVLLGVPAWRLLGDAEVLFTSAAVIVAFLLWRRQVGGWAALAVACVTVVAWTDPRKAYEMVALAVFLPWALETFARPPRARLHWLPAGVLAGLMVITYQAWVVYAAIGLIVLIVLGWRTEPDRWAYLRRIGLVVLVATITSAWYVLPYLWGTLTQGGQMVSDLYASSYYNHELLPFLNLRPGELSTLPLRMLQLVGLVGLIWLARSAWWARPLLLIAAGAFAYRLLSMIRFLVTGHTGFGHYTARLYGVVLAVAGVLVIAHAAPVLFRRLRLTPPPGLLGAALAVVLAWSVVWLVNAWMPGTAGPGSAYAVAAHVEPLPGGRYPRYAPESDRPVRFPVRQVQRAVEAVAGPEPHLVTLSVDERLFSYLPWPGYLSNDRTAGSTMSRWDERKAAVRRLADTAEPAAFAAASAETGFGPIDVFVLRHEGDSLVWADLRFDRAQFDPQHWTVLDGLPERIVVAVRN